MVAVVEFMSKFGWKFQRNGYQQTLLDYKWAFAIKIGMVSLLAYIGHEKAGYNQGIIDHYHISAPNVLLHTRFLLS